MMARKQDIAALAVAATVMLGGCGDRPLGSVGELSREVVHGDVTTSTTIVVEDPGGARTLPLRRAGDLVWINQTADEPPTSQAVVLTRVWQRGDGVNRFIQASPVEIAVVLPGVDFPETVPDDVGYVSSQLVFDVQSGTLDADTAAAFGLWNTIPYSVGRDIGQLAVLRVGVADDAETVDIAAFEVEEGRSLTWSAAGYRYELFCRANVDEALCWHMAENMRPLSTFQLAPPVAP